MGHIHLGVLPKSKPWRAVVGLLTDGASDEEVVAASARAAERDLGRAVRNPVYVESIRLLAMIPAAARDEDFGVALRELRIPVGHSPGLFDLAAAVGTRLDEISATSGAGNDFDELSRRALLSTLTTQLGDRLPGLLEASPEDLQTAARSLSAPRAFSGYARAYFTRLLSETLRYWLDRELCAHIGGTSRFADMGARSTFDVALTQFCSEATFIMREFANGWYAKALRREGAIDSRSAAAFGAIAFRKIAEELRLKRGGDV